MGADDFKKFESGFNEGFLLAAQVVASRILVSINAHPSMMLPSDRERFKAQVKLITRHILEQRKLIPTTYQVLRGEAEEVKLNFQLYK